MRKIYRENHCFHRCGAPSVSHQAPRFPLTGAGPKREQNLIHSEPKAVPDRFTFYSRFGEIYNGKRCYRILRRTYLLDLEDSYVRPFFFFFTWPKGGERESRRKKNKLNHILRLLSSRIIFVSLNTNPSFSRHKTVPNSQSQEINYSQTINGNCAVKNILRNSVKFSRNRIGKNLLRLLR